MIKAFISLTSTHFKNACSTRLTYIHIYVYKHTKINLIRQLDLLIHCKYGHFFKILNDQKLKKKKMALERILF